MKNNNVKKIAGRTKLFSAIGMFTVSAVMLASSTYAWFSMNKEVTATGISLTATVPRQLLIKGSSDNAIYKSAIAFNNSADSAVSTSAALTNMFPVAYKAREASLSNPNNTFKKLTTAGMVKVDNDGRVAGAAYTASDVEAAIENTDYFHDTFTLKYAGEFVSTLSQTKVTIKYTDSDTSNTASPITGALHVVLVDDAGTPNAYEFDMGSAVAGTGDDVGKMVLAPQDITAFASSNQEITYNIYVFYDGEDADCKNSNAVNMDNYSFDFAFELIDTSTPSGAGG